ncbi:hypothetical protein K1X76_12550 [bacterium]|nr:hypothetical protein [bacterium]
MKIKIIFLGILCLLVSGVANAKQKKQKTIDTSETTQQEPGDTLQQDKPIMCYTHTKKWHPCPVQPKNKKEKS